MATCQLLHVRREDSAYRRQGKAAPTADKEKQRHTRAPWGAARGGACLVEQVEGVRDVVDEVQALVARLDGEAEQRSGSFG